MLVSHKGFDICLIQLPKAGMKQPFFGVRLYIFFLMEVLKSMSTTETIRGCWDIKKRTPMQNDRRLYNLLDKNSVCKYLNDFDHNSHGFA